MSQDDRPIDRPEDEVESLFHLAGRRPRLADPVVAPIKAAARAAWRSSVRRTARRRAVGIGVAVAAGLLLAIGLALREPETSHPPQPLGKLEVETGDVLVTGSQGPRQVLTAGSVITTGTSGRAALRLAGGPSVRIDVASVVRIESADVVALDRGGAYVDSGPASAGTAAIEIATALGSVRHVGTQFEVRLLGAPQWDEPVLDEQGPGEPSAAAALRVRVREGTVLVEHAGRTYEARAGAELVLSAGGEEQRATAPVEGAIWDWVQETAPPLDIEGTTLAVFLDWVSRETGLPCRFSDPALERAALGTVLHGSIAGLTPEEALSVVLPGCGLAPHRVEGALLLEPATP